MSVSVSRRRWRRGRGAPGRRPWRVCRGGRGAAWAPPVPPPPRPAPAPRRRLRRFPPHPDRSRPRPGAAPCAGVRPCASGRGFAGFLARLALHGAPQAAAGAAEDPGDAAAEHPPLLARQAESEGQGAEAEDEGGQCQHPERRSEEKAELGQRQVADEAPQLVVQRPGGRARQRLQRHGQEDKTRRIGRQAPPPAARQVALANQAPAPGEKNQRRQQAGKAQGLHDKVGGVGAEQPERVAHRRAAGRALRRIVQGNRQCPVRRNAVRRQGAGCGSAGADRVVPGRVLRVVGQAGQEDGEGEDRQQQAGELDRALLEEL